MKRNFALDVLRGIAVLLVIAFHAGNPDLFPEEHVSWFQTATSVCWAGVDLFFVLSGFLISGLLFEEADATGTIQLRRFWLRRGFKIWPSYFAAYGAMVLITCAYHLRSGAWTKIETELLWAIPNIFFVQNYLLLHKWPNSWSIAVEEHFYLALPIVLTLLLRSRGAQSARASQPGQRFSGLLAGGAVFCLVVLLLRLFEASRPSPNQYAPTHFRADSLCFGVMLGYLRRYRRPVFDKLARLWPLALVLAPLALLSSFPLGMPWPGYPPAPGQPPHQGNYFSAFTVGFTLLYLGLGSLVIVAGAYPDAGTRAPRALRAPLEALAFVGVYSYTIYLAQAVVPNTPGYFAATKLVRRHLWDSLWMGRILFVVCSFALGVLLSHVVERPALKLRERWIPRANGPR